MTTWAIGPLQVVTEDEILHKRYIVVTEHKIADFCSKEQLQPEWSLLNVNVNMVAMPGMIDQHIHGIAGADAMDASLQSFITMSNELAKFGVTGFLATTMTASEQSIMRAVGIVPIAKQQLQGAKLLGIHLEGPFIHPLQKGAQPATFIQVPNIEQFKHFQDAAQNEIKLVTMAVELDEQAELTRYLKKHGIAVSVGHSNAAYDEIMPLLNEQLIDSATHFSNGMRPIHHREPGLQVALMQTESYIELIADGHHLHPNYIKWVIDQVGLDRIILVSDSMRAANEPDGIYELGGQAVQLREGVCTLVDGSSLAGSVLNLHVARNNMKNWFGLSYIELAKITATNSAKLLHIDKCKGSLKVDKYADFYILDNNDNVVLTVIEGKILSNEVRG